MGMACMATAAMLFPVKDSFMKMQDDRVPILLAVGLYFFIQACIAFTVVTFKERRFYGNPFAGMKWLNLGRSLALATSMGLFFAGLRHVPLAVAFALFTIQGLFIVVLGYFILGEALRLRHVLLVFMAICGGHAHHQANRTWRYISGKLVPIGRGGDVQPLYRAHP
jgi:drug/metabolite transporter (DMT)-like permease